MLHRADAAAYRVLEALAAERVDHHAAPLARRLEYGYLVSSSVNSAKSPSSWAERMPPVVQSLISRLPPAALADDLAHVVRPVAPVRRPSREVRQDVVGRHLECGPRKVAVDVAAGLADRDDRDLQARRGRTRAMASRMPASAPAASRTKVTPASSVRRKLCAVRAPLRHRLAHQLHRVERGDAMCRRQPQHARHEPAIGEVDRGRVRERHVAADLGDDPVLHGHVEAVRRNRRIRPGDVGVPEDEGGGHRASSIHCLSPYVKELRFFPELRAHSAGRRMARFERRAAIECELRHAEAGRGRQRDPEHAVARGVACRLAAQSASGSVSGVHARRTRSRNRRAVRDHGGSRALPTTAAARARAAGACPSPRTPSCWRAAGGRHGRRGEDRLLEDQRMLSCADPACICTW